MVEAAQFGVSMPGGAEALVHTRETIEAAIRSDPSCGVWATVDVDFQNAFLGFVMKPLTLQSVLGSPSSSRGRDGARITAELFSCLLARNAKLAGARSKAIPSHQCNAGVSLPTSSFPPWPT